MIGQRLAAGVRYASDHAEEAPVPARVACGPDGECSLSLSEVKALDLERAPRKRASDRWSVVEGK